MITNLAAWCPSFPNIPKPTWASCIIDMSLAPSPMAAGIGFSGLSFTSFTICLKYVINYLIFIIIYVGSISTWENEIFYIFIFSVWCLAKAWRWVSPLNTKCSEFCGKLTHRGFHIKIGGRAFLKFRISLTRTLLSDTSLELVALISNFATPQMYVFIVFRFFSELALPVDGNWQIS